MAKLKTGRHTSALKKVRKDITRTSRNRGIKNQIKQAAKNFLKSLEAGDIKTSEKLLRQVYSRWDKAVKSGVIHKNTASRKKSRLAARLKKQKKHLI